MNQTDSNTDQATVRRKVYSAPRRFDLATIFVVIIFYSCLLGLLVGFGVPDEITLSILGFLTIVAVAQPVMFGGRNPRLASVVVGGLAWPVVFTLTTFMTNSRVPASAILYGGLCSIPMGLLFGYLAGATVGGVFLIAEFVRRGRGLAE